MVRDVPGRGGGNQHVLSGNVKLPLPTPQGLPQPNFASQVVCSQVVDVIVQGIASRGEGHI